MCSIDTHTPYNYISGKESYIYFVWVGSCHLECGRERSGDLMAVLEGFEVGICENDLNRSRKEQGNVGKRALKGKEESGSD